LSSDKASWQFSIFSLDIPFLEQLKVLIRIYPPIGFKSAEAHMTISDFSEMRLSLPFIDRKHLA